MLYSYAGVGRSGIFIMISSVLVPIRPLTIRSQHRAGLTLVRDLAPPMNLIGFRSLADLTIVSTSKNRPKPG